MIRILEIEIELDFFFFFFSFFFLEKKNGYFFCHWYNYRRPAVGSGGGFRIATSSLLTQELLAGKVKAFKGASLALPFLVFPRLDIEFVSTEREREREMYVVPPPNGLDLAAGAGEGAEVLRAYQTWKGSNVSIALFFFSFFFPWRI